MKLYRNVLNTGRRAEMPAEYFVTSCRYDLTGNEISRVAKHFFISKMAPHENFAGGPGRLGLTVMVWIHALGRVLSWILVGQEAKIRYTFNRHRPKLSKIKARLKKTG